MINFLLDQNLISPEQHGVLPGKSIHSNLLCCLADWTREVDRENSIDLIYLYFSKALDRVPKRRLLYKLQRLGVRGSLIKWIESFLSDRTFSVKVGNSLSRSVEALWRAPGFSIRTSTFSGLHNRLKEF